MQRLTEYRNGKATLKNTIGDMPSMQPVIELLARYEDTLYTPEEVLLFVKCQSQMISKRELELEKKNDVLEAENIKLKEELYDKLSKL